MAKRIGLNLDSTEHATFNWTRPIPAYSKVRSQFNRRSTTFLGKSRIITGPTVFMRAFKRRFVFAAGVVFLILFWSIAVGPEPPARISISPEELVRAVTIQRDSLIDLCLIEHVDPNGRDAQGRTPLLIATSQQDWKTAHRLLDAGALVDLADKNGFTPLIAALQAGKKEQIRLVLGKHSVPPTPEGKKVPFLAYSIAGNNSSLFNTLLTCGADPNTVLPSHCDKDFLALLSSQSLRSYVEED